MVAETSKDSSWWSKKEILSFVTFLSFLIAIFTSYHASNKLGELDDSEVRYSYLDKSMDAPQGKFPPSAHWRSLIDPWPATLEATERLFGPYELRSKLLIERLEGRLNFHNSDRYIDFKFTDGKQFYSFRIRTNEVLLSVSKEGTRFAPVKRAIVEVSSKSKLQFNFGPNRSGLNIDGAQVLSIAADLRTAKVTFTSDCRREEVLTWKLFGKDRADIRVETVL